MNSSLMYLFKRASFILHTSRSKLQIFIGRLNFEHIGTITIKLSIFIFLLCSSLLLYSQEYNCSDNIDSDGDGLFDCADIDCATNSSCQNCIPCTHNSTFYQVLHGDEFVSYDPTNLTYTTIYTNSFEINAIGYNVQDGHIYGIRNNSNHLVKVGEDGIFNDLGPVSGLPDPGGNSYYIGDFDENGNLFVSNNFITDIYKIDILSIAATRIQLNPRSPMDLADFSYLPLTQLFYGLQSGTNNLISFDATTGAVFNLGTLNPLVSCSNGYGASFADKNGKLYFFCNGDGNLFEVDQSVMTSNLLHATGISLNSNDGASCPFSNGLQPCDNSLPSFCTYSCTSDPVNGLDYSDVAYDQVVYPDGSRTIVGVVNDGGDRIYLEKIDNCGNHLESWFYTPNIPYTNIGKVRMTIDETLNQYVLAFEMRDGTGNIDVYIMTINAAFTPIDITAPVILSNDDKETVEKIIVDSDNAYVLIINQKTLSGNNNVFGVKYTTALNLAWIRQITIAGSINMKAFDIVESTQSLGLSGMGLTSYLMTGIVDHQAFVIGLDWELTPSPANVIDIDADPLTKESIQRIVFDGSHFYTIGNQFQTPFGATTTNKVWISKLDINTNYVANRIWIQLLDKVVSADETAIDLALSNDGLIFTGQVEKAALGTPLGTTVSDIAYISHYDFAGNELWSKTYDSTGSQINDLEVTSFGLQTIGVERNCEASFIPPGYTCSSDIFRMQLYRDGSLEDSLCINDFTFIEQTKTEDYSLEPATYLQIPNNIDPQLIATDTAPFDKDCCSEMIDVCNVSTTLHAVTNASCCMVSLDLINLNNNVYSIEFEIQDPNIFFDQIILSGGLFYSSTPTANPTRIYIDNGGSAIPIGSLSNFIQFCYGNNGIIPSTSQTLKITYFDQLGKEITECCDIIETDCQLDPTDEDCIEICPIEIVCDSTDINKFKFCFQVKNNTNPPRVLDGIRLDIVDPNLNIIPTVHPLTTPINSGVKSGIECVDIYASSSISYPYSFQLTPAAKDTSNTFCCADADTLNLVLPNCCDPCEVDWITESSNSSSLGECCYAYDFQNECDKSLVKIKASLSPGGADFSSVAIGSAYTGNWFINPQGSDEIEIIPSTTPVSAGLYADLLTFCVDNSSPTNSPTVQFEYIMNGTPGQDSVACIKVDTLSCDNETPCLELVRDSIFCDAAGNYFLDFCVENTSNNPAFNIGQIDINNITTPLFVSPTTFTGLNIRPNDMYCDVVQIYSTAVGGPQVGDVLSIGIESHSSDLDTCCVNGVFIGTSLLDCETCVDVIDLDEDHLIHKSYHAEEVINSQSKVKAQSSIEYQAGNEIHLDPGFSTDLNSEFLANIEECQTIESVFWNCDPDCQTGYQNLECGEIKVNWVNCIGSSYRVRIFYRDAGQGSWKRQTFNSTYGGSYTIPDVVPGNWYQYQIQEKKKWACSWKSITPVVTVASRVCGNTSEFRINNSSANPIEICGFENVFFDGSMSLNTGSYTLCLQETDQNYIAFGPKNCQSYIGTPSSNIDLQGLGWHLIGGKFYEVQLTTYDQTGNNPVSSSKIIKMKLAKASINPVDNSGGIIPCLAVSQTSSVREYQFSCDPSDIGFTSIGTRCDQGYYVEVAEVIPNISGGYNNVNGTVFSDWVDLNNPVPTSIDMESIYTNNFYPAFQSGKSYRIKLAVRFPWDSDEFIIHF